MLAAVLSRTPDLSVLPAATPAGVRRLLQRCLDRDRRHRLQTAADARLRLEEIAVDTPEPAAHPAVMRVKSRGWMVAAIGLLVVAVALAVPTVKYVREAPHALPRCGRRSSRPRRPTADPSRFHPMTVTWSSRVRTTGDRNSGSGRWRRASRNRSQAPRAARVHFGPRMADPWVLRRRQAEGARPRQWACPHIGGRPRRPRRHLERRGRCAVLPIGFESPLPDHHDRWNAKARDSARSPADPHPTSVSGRRPTFHLLWLRKSGPRRRVLGHTGFGRRHPADSADAARSILPSGWLLWPREGTLWAQ